MMSTSKLNFHNSITMDSEQKSYTGYNYITCSKLYRGTDNLKEIEETLINAFGIKEESFNWNLVGMMLVEKGVYLTYDQLFPPFCGRAYPCANFVPIYVQERAKAYTPICEKMLEVKRERDKELGFINKHVDSMFSFAKGFCIAAGIVALILAFYKLFF